MVTRPADHQGCGGRRGVGGADDVGHGRSGGAGSGTAGPPVSAGASPRRQAPGRDARRGVRVAAAGGRGKRQPTGRHAAVAARGALNGHSPSSIKIASGDSICMKGIICIARCLPGSIRYRRIGPGPGFCPVRTKGDDGGRHRRRRQVNRVFMSRCFDRPDFPDFESHSGCHASGQDGRYFPASEVTHLIVVLHLALRVRPAVGTRRVLRLDTYLGIKVGGPLLGVLRCGDRGHPIGTRAPLPWLSDVPHLPGTTGPLLRSRCLALAG